ncbi:MAG: T9SS type A sorting domain-containing protein [Flavobacteriales bacterium]
MELFSPTGQLYIDETSTTVELINVNTAQLAPGSYVVRLTATNARNTMKVVK